MGSRRAPEGSLPKADAIGDDALYELKTLEAPVLRGLPLWLFSLITRTPLWGPLWASLTWKSGLPQVLHLKVPEAPLFRALARPSDAAKDQELTATLGVATQPAIPGDVPPERHASECLAVAAKAAARGPSAAPRRATILDYHDAYKQGSTTPTVVVAAILSKIKDPGSPQANAETHWFLYYGVGAEAAAAASTERWRAGTPRSVLDGVPFAVKDNYDVAEYPTHAGTTFLPSVRVNPGDCPAVRSLRAAGAILVGKTTMHELGLSTLGVNAHHGVCRNPWSRDHLCGGSSSGSAGVVGSGLVPFALGGDGGGSIRIPAGFCGAFGLMPTQGRLQHQECALDFTVAVGGPLTTCAEDALLVYTVMAAEQPPDVPLLRLPISLLDRTSSLTGLKVGVYREWSADCNPEVHAAYQTVLQRLVSRGATLLYIVIPDLELCRVAHTVTIGTEILQQFRWVFDSKLFYELGLDLQVAFKSMSMMSAADYLAAQRIRRRMTLHMERVFKEVDLVVTPTSPVTAPPRYASAESHGESNLRATSEIMRYAQLANFLGLPACALPCGLDAAGLPISFHMMAPPWHEASLLAVASAIQDTAEFDAAWNKTCPTSCNPLQEGL